MSQHRCHASLPRRLAAALILLQAGSCGSVVNADDQVQVGYEYATWLRTGGSRVGGRDVFILRLPFFKRIRAGT